MKVEKIRQWTLGCLVIVGIAAPLLPAIISRSQADDATYYVSSSTGSDSYDGLSIDTPFETIDKVNSLTLLPGDQVLFKRGDSWWGSILFISASGTEQKPIVFGAYSTGSSSGDDALQPVLSGARPVAGWTLYRTNIYMADLNTGNNADRFAYGVNQCFRGDERLPMGRWPNLDEGSSGYATIDAHAGSQMTDSDLSEADWTGAVAHIRGMRWYILNREVTAQTGATLTLGAAADCWGESCAGWGYFLNRHLNTLDQEGEWYYDTATHCLYIYTTGGVPTDGDIEGSVILKDDDRSWGGIMLGKDLSFPGVSHVRVQDLCVTKWFRHGIATPTNHAHDENHHIKLLDNTISHVDGKGISLAAWVWGAPEGQVDGWRGGYNMTIQGNTIDAANSMGMNLYCRDSTIKNNIIRDVGIIENLGAAGLGCSFNAGGGACTEDGDGIRVKLGDASKIDDSGNANTFTGNRLTNIAYNGMDVFGPNNTFVHNIIRNACVTKGDCGGVRTFGTGSLGSSPVHDLLFEKNIIIDTLGNTDGCHSDYQALLGFGFYIDHYSRDVALTGNTVIGSSVHGVLYQNSSGSIINNTLYDNSRYVDWSAQVWLTGSPMSISAHTGNILYSLNGGSWTLSMGDTGMIIDSDDNYFFSPYRAEHIRIAGESRSLSSWQDVSGKDWGSFESWFTLESFEAPLSEIFYNDDTNQIKAVDPGTSEYVDLDQMGVQGPVLLDPCTSWILVGCPPPGFCYGDVEPTCFRDDDVDGLDLFEMLKTPENLVFEMFAGSFGVTDCLGGDPGQQACPVAE